MQNVKLARKEKRCGRYRTYRSYFYRFSLVLWKVFIEKLRHRALNCDGYENVGSKVMTTCCYMHAYLFALVWLTSIIENFPGNSSLKQYHDSQSYLLILCFHEIFRQHAELCMKNSNWGFLEMKLIYSP